MSKKQPLSITHPELSKEWHPTKNKPLTPKDVTLGMGKKVWWVCKKGHEFNQRISHRSRGSGCAFCSGRYATKTNNLLIIYPEIAKEWSKKNGDLKPSDFTEFSGKMVWWKDLYGHTWKTSIRSRSNGNNCPFCSSQSSQYEIFILSEIEWVFSNVEHRKKIEGQEVDIYIPSIELCIEIDGSYWHRNRRNNDKKKNIILENLGYSIIRLREKPLRKISENDIIFTFSKDKIETIESLLNYIRINFKQTNVVQSKMDKWLSQKVQQNLEYYNKLLSFLFQKQRLSL